MNYTMTLPTITWDSIKGVSIPPGFNFVDPYLSVSPSVILTQPIVDSIVAVRPWFQDNPGSTVTSGYRSPNSQVQVIISYLKFKGLLNKFPEINQGITNNWAASYKIPINLTVLNTSITSIYWWQRAWSYELSDDLKIIINPAYEAMCLFHSTRDNGSDRIGSILSQTNHASGYAYDIGGGFDHDPTNEYNVMLKAQKDPSCKIKDIVLEHNNDCTHTDVNKVI